MCGRYFFTLMKHPSFDKLRQKISQNVLFEYAHEEIFPSNQSLVLIADKADYTLDIMKWGIEGFYGKQLINARSEGIEGKKTFHPMLHNRCLIPCNGFYEWVTKGNRKQKIFIKRQDIPLFYLAGIYNDQKEYVIVTGDSQHEMKHLHNRTPILIKEEQISAYLDETLDFVVNNEGLSFENQDAHACTHEQLELFEEEENT